MRLPVHRNGRAWRNVEYMTANTEILAWVMARVGERSFAQSLHERFWAPLGCEVAGYLVVDPAGMAIAGGGLSATARDLARFSQLMRRGGAWNGKQLIPASMVHDVQKGGDPTNSTMRPCPALHIVASGGCHNELDASHPVAGAPVSPTLCHRCWRWRGRFPHSQQARIRSPRERLAYTDHVASTRFRGIAAVWAAPARRQARNHLLRLVRHIQKLAVHAFA